MIGIIKKDILNTIQQWQMMLLVLAGGFIFYSFTQNFNGLFIYAAAIAVLMTASAFTAEDRGNLVPYTLSMPVARVSVALAKYLFAAIIALALYVVIFAALIIASAINPAILGTGGILGSAAVALVCFEALLIILAVFIPLTYRFKAERSRLLLLGLILVAYFFSVFIQGRDGVSSDILNQNFILILGGAAVVLTALSIWMCSAIFKKRDF